MNGQEKSLFSESLATDENRLGFESLADRLERYACGKKRALDMTNYITERCGGKKKTGRPSENLRLVAKMKHAVLIWFSSIISIAMKYGYTRRSFVKAYAMPILCHAPRGEVRSGLPRAVGCCFESAARFEGFYGYAHDKRRRRPERAV